ncbi:hypothetical protein M8J77_019831 [Diaphorina citri]|nr:hypothetical protein M8J77_019831 [Diaphorina citri]
MRADYWKSQDRKYCDFCKCWIADNKPSIQFHESGKKHKENVSKRLSEISKQSVIDQKKRDQDNADFKKMEEEALKAYMKDIDRGGDYSSQQIKDKYDIPLPSKSDLPNVPLPQSPYDVPLPLPSKHVPGPEEVLRDRLCGPSSSKSSRSSKPTYSEPIGPQMRAPGGALGQWETVEEEKLPELDLPQRDYVELQVPTLHSDYPEFKVKEKTVQSLKDKDSFVKKEEDGAPAFKKRKVNRGDSNQLSPVGDTYILETTNDTRHKGLFSNPLWQPFSLFQLYEMREKYDAKFAQCLNNLAHGCLIFSDVKMLKSRDIVTKLENQSRCLKV